ncbi:MAG TPA: hypothetical protein PK573_12990 [Spirochaetota bacterium]|nr:hypothetical protein [Spirochaetota bacterium]HRZ25421.1 hypothetical protein [Spirochaetota bacterium]HSA15111.1 hypothetical protein [Spirochaetota bacterium]
MFIGHYGIGFILKKKFREIPLWVYFACLQLTDILSFILVLAGIERASYRESANPFFRNDLYLPYSHSLAGAIALSAAAYVFFIAVRRRSWALIAALCVLSHWFIDLIVHTPDLSLFFGYCQVGLGLWNCPYVSFGIEIAFTVGGWLVLGYRNVWSFVLLFALIGSLTGMVFGSEPAMFRNSQSLRTLLVLGSNLIFIALAWCAERRERA